MTLLGIFTTFTILTFFLLLPPPPPPPRLPPPRRIIIIIDRRRQSGNTALHWCSHEGHSECVEELLAAGADTNARSRVRWLVVRVGDADRDELRAAAFCTINNPFRSALRLKSWGVFTRSYCLCARLCQACIRTVHSGWLFLFMTLPSSHPITPAAASLPSPSPGPPFTIPIVYAQHATSLRELEGPPLLRLGASGGWGRRLQPQLGARLPPVECARPGSSIHLLRCASPAPPPRK